MTTSPVPHRPATRRADLRLRLMGALVRWIGPVGSDMTAEQIARARAWPSDTPLARLVAGVPAPDVHVVRRRMELPGRSLPLVVYRPKGRGDGAMPLVVALHGGGWVIGSAHHNQWECSHVASRVGAVVVSVGYRMAPEHPFPAAVDDAWDALCCIADRADALGADPARIAVMGDSAGGNLAAVVSQLARDHGGPRIARQVLIYPATDMRPEFAAGPEFDDAPLLPKADRDAYLGHYLGDWTDRTDPRLSPACAESLAGLPPALIITAEHDPLRADGWRYADRLAAEGVEVRLTDYVGMAHGFLSVPRIASGARQALGEICQVLSTTV